MSNKEFKTESRRKYRGMWPNAREKRHRHRKGRSGSLRKGKVFLWDTGVVTAFNEAGELIHEILGMYSSVRDVILLRYHRSTAFFRCCSWQQEPHEGMTLDEFKTGG
jgi:hypothetical protein